MGKRLLRGSIKKVTSRTQRRGSDKPRSSERGHLGSTDHSLRRFTEDGGRDLTHIKYCHLPGFGEKRV